MNNEEKILSELTQIKSDISEMQGETKEIKEIRSEMKEMQGEIREMQGEIKEMQGEIKEMQGNISAMQHTITATQESILIMLTNMERMQTDISDIKKEQAHTNQRLTALEATTQDMKEIMVKMEVDHEQKMNTLFDAYDLLHRKIGGMHVDVADIKGMVEKHEFYFRWMNPKTLANVN